MSRSVPALAVLGMTLCFVCPAAASPAGADGRLETIAASLPGFGGLFIDETDGRVYVWLAGDGPELRAAAAARIATLLGDDLSGRAVEVLPASFRFRELAAWHERVAPGLLGRRGVVFTDVDETFNRLTVAVEDEGLEDEVHRFAADHGVPRGAVRVIRRRPIRFAATVRDRHRPLRGGLQMAFPFEGQAGICTIGFFVGRRGVRGWIANSHCTSVQGELTKNGGYQPGISPGERIGAETRDPPYFEGGECPPGRVCRYSDTAFYRQRSGLGSRRGEIVRTPRDSFAWNESSIYRVREEGVPVAGQVLTKVGRSTGLTQGTVSFTDVNVNVADTNITLLRQDIVESFSGEPIVAPGDSGSPVFQVIGGVNVRLMGLLWGASEAGDLLALSSMSAANIQRRSEMGPVNACAPPDVC